MSVTDRDSAHSALTETDFTLAGHVEATSVSILHLFLLENPYAPMLAVVANI
jgi:hypothetical protein